jgi:hypothetical protein
MIHVVEIRGGLAPPVFISAIGKAESSAYHPFLPLQSKDCVKIWLVMDSDIGGDTILCPFREVKSDPAASHSHN